MMILEELPQKTIALLGTMLAETTHIYILHDTFLPFTLASDIHIHVSTFLLLSP